MIDATGAGADVSVSTATPDAAPIRVFDQSARGVLDVSKVRRALVAVLLAAGLLAGGSLSAAAVYGFKLGGEQDEMTRRIAERRVALRAGREGGKQVASPLRALERRKYQTAASVIVLDVLSQILPDHTYVTELRIEGDKLRVIGVTRDAPALILIEQSPYFTRATFFAPTTRAPSIRASASTSRRRSNPYSRCAHEPRRTSRLPLLRQSLAVVGYVAVVAVLLALAWSAVSDILDRKGRSRPPPIFSRSSKDGEWRRPP